MNVKTMEGIVGARTNMDLVNTPMRVFKEARRKGDTATMERAMGYVNDFSDKAEDYKAKADEGMEEDAREAREKAKVQREEAIRKRREECEKPEGETSESREEDTGTYTNAASAVKEPVTYTKTGETVSAEQSTSISVSI